MMNFINWVCNITIGTEEGRGGRGWHGETCPPSYFCMCTFLCRLKLELLLHKCSQNDGKDSTLPPFPKDILIENRTPPLELSLPLGGHQPMLCPFNWGSALRAWLACKTKTKTFTRPSIAKRLSRWIREKSSLKEKREEIGPLPTFSPQMGSQGNSFQLSNGLERR